MSIQYKPNGFKSNTFNTNQANSKDKGKLSKITSSQNKSTHTKHLYPRWNFNVSRLRWKRFALFLEHPHELCFGSQVAHSSKHLVLARQTLPPSLTMLLEQCTEMPSSHNLDRCTMSDLILLTVHMIYLIRTQTLIRTSPNSHTLTNAQTYTHKCTRKRINTHNACVDRVAADDILAPIG